MIAGYLSELTGALSFDRRLARRVAREVEDHLLEAAAGCAPADRAEAERRAIANFGEPLALAAQFAAISLARRTRWVGVAVVAAVVLVVIAMRVRVAWYAAANWTMGEGVRELAGIVLAIDRLAFWTSIIVGAAALACAGFLRVPPVLHPDYCRQTRRIVFLCTIAALSLLVSVISDGVLTVLQFTSELREAAVVPLLSMAAEIVCVSAVAFLIVDAIRRVGQTGALLKV